MDSEIVNIVCWKWVPLSGAPRTKKQARFTSDHVNALYTMLEKHLTIPFQLFCVTDDEKGIWDDKIHVVSLWDEFRQLGGCFLRLVVFKQDFILFGSRFFSIDLDCVIVGNCDQLFKRQGQFVVWRPEENDHRIATFCGSFWALTAGSRPIVYDSFDPDKKRYQKNGKYLGGTDQLHISDTLPNADVFTKKDGIYNFVPDIRVRGCGALPSDAKIVFFNGKFMPDDALLLEESPWIKEHYPLAGMAPTVFSVDKERRRLRRKQSRRDHKIPYAYNKLQRTFKIGMNDPVRLPTSFVLYWWGGWPDGTDKGLDYVYRAVKAITRYAPQGLDYNIVLFTDVADTMIPAQSKVDVRPLNVPVDLCWNLKKMYMFSDMADLTGYVLCLDLDCIITGDLSPIITALHSIEAPELLYTCQAAYKKGAAGGSVVGFKWCVKLFEKLWMPIVEHRRLVEKQTKGSERIYYRQRLSHSNMRFWEDMIPGAILSYKRDCKEGLPADASIIRFHGSPRPHEVTDQWVKERL